MKSPEKSVAYTYECRGAVRGPCEHNHTTEEDALQCLLRDNAECAARIVGGYSDRRVYRSDGQRAVTVVSADGKVTIERWATPSFKG